VPATLEGQILEGFGARRFPVLYDGLRWFAEAQLEHLHDGPTAMVVTHITFSTDRFSHPINPNHTQANQLPLTAFLAFGAYLGGEVQHQVRHHIDGERFDVRMRLRDESTQSRSETMLKRLTLTFENGWPDGGYDMDDDEYWS
jgi:hypothetical protein